MDVKNLIGYNAFQTAENVYTVVKHYKEPRMSLELMIDKIYNFQTVGIEDTAFAKTLFQYLLQYQQKQEALVKRFIEYLINGEEPMKALSKAVNSLS
jgi:hypothetical protein